MKKAFLFGLIFVLLSSFVMADIEEITEKVNIPIKLDFIGIDNFKLTIEDNERTFSWNNETNMDDLDENWIWMINHSFTCQTGYDLIKAYRNMTLVSQDMATLCADVVRYGKDWNLTQDYISLTEGVGRQSEKLQECNNDLVVAQEKANQYDACGDSLSAYKGDLSACRLDLKEAEEKSESSPILWAAGAGIAVWFFMRKKEAKPQEFDEFPGQGP